MYIRWDDSCDTRHTHRNCSGTISYHDCLLAITAPLEHLPSPLKCLPRKVQMNIRRWKKYDHIALLCGLPLVHRCRYGWWGRLLGSEGNTSTRGNHRVLPNGNLKLGLGKIWQVLPVLELVHDNLKAMGWSQATLWTEEAEKVCRERGWKQSAEQGSNKRAYCLCPFQRPSKNYVLGWAPFPYPPCCLSWLKESHLLQGDCGPVACYSAHTVKKPKPTLFPVRKVASLGRRTLKLPPQAPRGTQSQCVSI